MSVGTIPGQFGVFQARNIEALFLKLTIAKQRNLNGDGRGDIYRGGLGPF